MKSTLILIAHDAKKADMVRWAGENREKLAKFNLFATGTTGKRIADETGLEITRLLSGPQGGDAQAGAMIATGEAQGVIFFWDPLSPQPHDVDVRTVLRLAVLHDVPIACNLSTATLIVGEGELA